ncbi:MAG: glucose-1-phosphate thymidylyltransferase [Chloroflexi bacterium]|nr:glucose-1-phosphate thymidylyltransferase [Chloroflexota bacterium]
MLTAADFFDLDACAFADLFAGTGYVWEAIARLGQYIERQFAQGLQPNAAAHAYPGVTFQHRNIFIGAGTHIDPGVMIIGPAIIGSHCEIRQGAYLRENILLGDHVVVGHTSELKNTVMMNHSHAPHFAYLGDSILGARVNLGAGSKLSNLALTSKPDPQTGKRPTIKLLIDDETIDTQLPKMGAILGDDVQLGCNCVTNPGCLIGPRTLAYPLLSLRKGYYPPDSVLKLHQDIDIVAQH